MKTLQHVHRVQTQEEPAGLLGYWDSIAITMGIVIGVGIFRVPAQIAEHMTSPNLFLLAWLVGGIISLLGALCYAELSSLFPITGGNYVYLRESYGLLTAFLFGWTEFLVIRTGSIAAVSFIFAEYLQSLFSTNTYLVKPIAISIVVMLSFLNLFGLRYTKRVQNISTAAKIAALIGIVVFGFVSGKGNSSHFQPVPIKMDGDIFVLFCLALVPILWTYGGWHENTFVAGETRNATRTLPVSLITGILMVILLYLAVNALYIYLIPLNQIANADLIGSNALQVLYGIKGRKTFELLIIISSLGCLNAMIITGSRVTYAMAENNAIFKYVGNIHAKFGTPHRAIIINALWTIGLITWGTFNQLLFFTGILVWLFFGLVGGGLFIFRYKFPHQSRPYKVWGYPVIPAAFVIICIALSVNTLIFYPFESLIGLGLALSGIPIFLISKMKITH